RHGYRIGVPEAGWYQELINTDSIMYGGSNVGNFGGIHSVESPCHDLPHSLTLTLPPLSVLLLKRKPGNES
ncbi:MAG: alpha amylase C-terminal domain-containing protein, partial [Nitrospirae bacterium]|nr:alpha amylase C-terminal domain-containing protein [Nitrospirota bacterium]